ncbi:hypothetical protein [Scytonema sp. HK-05]|uniref:hypothetical protein n=1 Tax=Scytonema sp. HK-05 TaxID=1137095 RepID=UPI000937B69B|nr:hypothetical protein [Scytonema sp. HK-05]
MPNFHSNSNFQAKSPSEHESSEVSLNLRLPIPPTLIAALVGAAISFGSSWAYVNTQNVNQNQNVNNCVQNSPVAKPR